MLKYSSIAAVVGVLAFCVVTATPASAQGGIELPGGDALDFTPPADITEQQVKSALRRDRRKLKAVQNGSYMSTKRRSRRIAVKGRGQ